MADEREKDLQALGDEFHMMVGYCIAEWASVDDELFRIFRDCVGPHEQCAIIYYRTPGLDSRFGLTDEIVKSVLPTLSPTKLNQKAPDHPSLLAWKAAKAGYSELLHTRRRIAHHPVELKIETGRLGMFGGPLNTQTFNSPGLPEPKSWFEIYVNSHERVRGNSANLPALRIEDLKEHLLSTAKLRDRLRRFFHEILITPAGRHPPSVLPQNSSKD